MSRGRSSPPPKPEDYTLLPTQKNDVFKAVQDGLRVFARASQQGMQIGDFVWKIVPSLFRKNCLVSQLNYKDTEYYARFDLTKKVERHEWCLEWSPAGEAKMARHTSVNWGWQYVQVMTWLMSLSEQDGVPDLWTEFLREPTVLDLSRSTTEDNRPFTPEEQQQIATGVEEIRRHIQEEHTVTQSQLQVINERLDHLIEASNRMGRKDWTMLMLGVLMSIPVGAMFAPEAAAAFLHFAFVALRAVLENIQYLPPMTL